MTDSQLSELEWRCHRAVRLGHVIGRGDQLAAMLMGECGPVEAPSYRFGSAQHLLRIIQAVRDFRSGKISQEKPGTIQDEQPTKALRKGKKNP